MAEVTDDKIREVLERDHFRFCNKCGFFGYTESEQGTHQGCDYSAAPSQDSLLNTQLATALLEARQKIERLNATVTAHENGDRETLDELERVAMAEAPENTEHQSAARAAARRKAAMEIASLVSQSKFEKLYAAQRYDAIEAIISKHTTHQSGWRDISSAPKDGSWQIVGRIDKGELNWWYKSRFKSGYWKTNGGACEPTHYLPLPAAPPEGDTEDEGEQK